MRDEQDVRALCERVLQMAAEGRAREAEVLFTGTTSDRTRFAINSTHQSVAEENERVSVRAVLGNKIGVVGGNQLDDASLRDLVRRAVAIASVQPENPDFKSLPGPAPIPPAPSAYSEATAAFGPEDPAARVRVVVRHAVERGFEAAVAFKTSVNQLAVPNALGPWAYHPPPAPNLTAALTPHPLLS